MTRTKLATGLAALVFLSACTTWDLDRLQQAEPAGDAFTRQLTEDYRALAAFEAYEMFDWVDQRHFARKGLKAAAGESVVPEPLIDWRVPADKASEMSGARTRLVTLLDGGGRSREPVLSARAQSHFDCWIEQQEENHQPAHIAACRDGFHRAAAALEVALTPRSFTVLFDFDTAGLTADGRSMVADAAAAFTRLGPAIVEARGHADRAGTEVHNRDLSQRRADAVKAALTSLGLSAETVATIAYGETAPLVATPDGVREPRNQRVEIVIRAARDLGA